MAISEQRLALFALISEFEADARSLIADYICNDHPLKEDIGEESYKVLRQRALKKLPAAEVDDRTILSFFDIGDAIRSLLSNKSILPNSAAAALNRVTKGLEALPAVRNRVMHRRPLEFGDLPLVTDTMRALVKTGPKEFDRVKSALREVVEGNHLKMFERAFSYESEPSVLNNLPQADYEDTGFLGRREQVDELKKAIAGPYPVITVLGVGGAGKSALALQVAYDVLNDENCAFDAVIWTSAKTTRLTGADIQNIAGAISSSVGVAQHALEQFGVKDAEDPFESVNELLKSFKVLLFIDNLETILDERIREFVKNVPVGSKVVFTSRIGLGAYDFVVPIRNLDSKEADTFFRRVAHVWKQTTLQQIAKEDLAQYLTRLNNSPLGIKWFIQAVAAGGSPQRLLSDPSLLLLFCLENIIDKLSKQAKAVLTALAVTGREQSPASLHYLTDIEPWTVEDALRELIGSHLTTVVVSKFGDDDRYRIASIAQTYITRLHSLSPTLQAQVRAKQHDLNLMAERAESERKRGAVYDPSYIVVRPDFAGTDAVAAKFLRRALLVARQGDYNAAYDEVQSAKSLAPSYFEVMRVEAFIAANEGNVMRAQNAYEEAVALRPDHVPMLVLYSGFLLKALGDGPLAESLMLKGLKADQESPEPRMEYSRTLLYQNKFDEAWDALRETDTTKLKNARAWRIFADLTIQTCSRSADKYLQSGTSAEFEKSISRLASVIREMPLYSLDNQSQNNMRFAIGLARRFIAREGESPDAMKVSAGLDIICQALEAERNPEGSNAPQLRGSIVMLSQEKPFGFIETMDGDRLFFHKGNMFSPPDFDRLDMGSEVTFSIGSNAQGKCADEVRLVDKR